MNNLKVFSNSKFGSVRTIVKDGEVWFVGIDVAKALEYVRPREAISAHCDWAVSYRLTDSLGRMRDTKIIPEGDVYRLIIKDTVSYCLLVKKIFQFLS